MFDENIILLLVFCVIWRIKTTLVEWGLLPGHVRVVCVLIKKLEIFTFSYTAVGAYRNAYNALVAKCVCVCVE